VWLFVVLFLSRRVLCCWGVVLVVSCVVLFLLCVCVCDLFLFLPPPRCLLLSGLGSQANSDDQTILDNVVLSAVLRNRSWLGSTFRWEASHKYKKSGVVWNDQYVSRLICFRPPRIYRGGLYTGRVD